MEEIRGLQFPRTARGLDAKDRAVLRYAELVTRAPAAIPETFLRELQASFTEEQIVDLTLVICLANMTNRFNDALEIEPDIGVVRQTGGMQ